MSPSYIALIILFGVAIMAGVAFAIQDYENKKRERSLRLIGLKTAIRRANHLLQAFPPTLITTEIYELLCNYIKVRWTAILELDPSVENQQQADMFKQAANELPASTGHKPGSLTIFNNSVEASRALGTIKEFAGFLAELKNKGDITPGAAENYAKEARRLYMRAEIDIDLMQAAETSQHQGPDVVIHYYKSCFSKLQNLNYNQSLDRQLYEIRTHITHLAEAIDEEQEEKRLAELKVKESGKKFNF